MKKPPSSPTSTPARAVAQLIKNYGIGLTGGIATGKSTVANLLRARNELVIDADDLARSVVEPGSPGLAAVVSAFGPRILHDDLTLNRAALRQIIFQDATQRARLDAIMHPLIRSALADALIKEDLLSKPRRFFYEAALLFETGTAQDFRAIWASHCAPEVQLHRLEQRDGVSAESARAALASQTPSEEKASLADVVINTNTSLADVELQVERILRLYDQD